MDISIKKAKTNDVIQLQLIASSTFTETFATLNTEENMRKYLTENLSLETLNKELNNNNSEFYFASHNNNIIGYLKVNFGEAQTESLHPNSLEIERIYVLKDYHGKQVAQQLLDKALQIAKQKQVNYIWLGVWEENPRAITFYKKHGFIEFDKHVFVLGNDKQTDILMKLSLYNNFNLCV